MQYKQKTFPFFKLLAPLLLFTANSNIYALSYEMNDIPYVSGEPVIQELQTILNGVDLRHTVYHQHFFNEKALNDIILGLQEGVYFGDDYDINYGIRLDLSPDSSSDNTIQLNHFSLNKLKENYDYRIGKFVSKIGTLDYLGNINHLNELQLNYYDESNINMRYSPSWMAQFNWYSNEDSTTSLFYKPMAKDEYAIDAHFYQYGLDALIPFLLVNTGNEDLNLVGEKVLLPVYEENGKAVVSKYLRDNWPEVASSGEDSTFGINHLITRDNFIIGFSAFSRLSKIPLIKINQELLDDLKSIDPADKEPYIEDYLENGELPTITKIEFERFYQLAGYFETSWNEFGLRGELSYRDKLPLLNQVTDQVTLGLGADYKNGFYTNLELRHSFYSDVETDSSAAFWIFQFEPWHKDGWEIKLQNVLTAAWVKEGSIRADLIKLALDKKDLQIAFEYLLHDKQEYAPDTFSLRLRVQF